MDNLLVSAQATFNSLRAALNLGGPGSRPLSTMPQYPGLGLDLRHNPWRDYGHYPIGAHCCCAGSVSEILPVREVAMMSIMDNLTEKEGWEKKVFDDEIVSKWRREALAIPDADWWKLVTENKAQRWDEDGTLNLRDDYTGEKVGLEGIISDITFDYIVKELRAKARYYEKSSIIPTFDACASVVKSDKLVSPELREELRKACNKLIADQAHAPDWHPKSKEMVQDLVHPSMYPLVYGRSRVFQDESVGVKDAIEKWAGKGTIIEKAVRPINENDRYRVAWGEVPLEYWSETYQWLPSNIAFAYDGTIRFTSYINNLHPNKYPDIYRTIENLIKASLPAWDQCLAVASGYRKRDGAGRIASRFPYPDRADDDYEENWNPSDREKFADVKVDWTSVEKVKFDPVYDDETEKKWQLFRKPVIPEPEFEDIDYAPDPEKNLAKKFADSGLQVIVKIASIELTPDKPEFPVGGWHVEGQMNEHVCGTALYYFDSENVTPSSLSFRMQTSTSLNEDISVGQDSYSWLEHVYGATLTPNGSSCLQNYGTVETHEGRLLAFPNVLQHRVSSFGLQDPTKPGHRRFIALWLVDPTFRIISTANVPPQQMDWWLGGIGGEKAEAREAVLSKLPPDVLTLLKEKGVDKEVITKASKLPQELVGMALKHLEADGGTGLPMSEDEAKEHRLKLMDERRAFVTTAESGWQSQTYGFCEH